MDHIPLMARFNGWVNERLYDSVAGLADDAYREDRGAFFGSIHATLNHLLVVDRLWTRRIEGVEHGIKALEQIQLGLRRPQSKGPRRPSTLCYPRSGNATRRPYEVEKKNPCGVPNPRRLLPSSGRKVYL